MPLVDLNLRDFFCMTMDDATNTGPDGGANGTAATETHDESTQGMMFDLQGVVCHKGESLSQVTVAVVLRCLNNVVGVAGTLCILCSLRR